jgi:hypothetical protein
MSDEKMAVVAVSGHGQAEAFERGRSRHPNLKRGG